MTYHYETFLFIFGDMFYFEDNFDRIDTSTFFFSFSFFFFSGLHLWHMEVPRLGVWSELHLTQQYQIRAESVTYTIAHDNTGSLTHWAKPGIKPKTSWFLVGFLSAAPPPCLPFLTSLWSRGSKPNEPSRHPGLTTRLRCPAHKMGPWQVLGEGCVPRQASHLCWLPGCPLRVLVCLSGACPFLAWWVGSV